LAAGQFVQTVEERQGYKIACLEEIAFRQGWIDRKNLLELARPLRKTEYGAYLVEIADEAQHISLSPSIDERAEN
jgi:glucose-1-phosphate thymidylyltransferase